jgi:hypothetical protein
LPDYFGYLLVFFVEAFYFPVSILKEKQIHFTNRVLMRFVFSAKQPNYAYTEPFGFLPPCGVLCGTVRHNILCTDKVNYMPLLPKFVPKGRSDSHSKQCQSQEVIQIKYTHVLQNRAITVPPSELYGQSYSNYILYSKFGFNTQRIKLSMAA